MRFNSLAQRFRNIARLPAALRRRLPRRPGGRSRAGDRQGWLPQADAALVTLARVSEPAALLVLIATGFALPALRAEWAPIPAVRALHGLAGLALLLVLLYRGLALGGRALAGLAGLARLVWQPARRPVRWPVRLPVRLTPGGWFALGSARRWRDGGVETAYAVTLAALVFTGVEHAWAARTGSTLLALLSPAQAQALHALAAPYFCAALLILSYIKGRKRGRALLDELRAP